MPIYEYRCDECGREIEVFGQTRETALPPTTCACGKERTFNRRFSTFAAHGTGPVSGPSPECCSGGNSHPCGGACHCGH